MKNREALKILISQKLILEQPNFEKHYLWKQQTLVYIERFLGSDSIEYKMLYDTTFPSIQEKNYNHILDVIKHKFATVVNQSIETIKNIGIKRTYHNFLCRYSDKELITYGIGIVLAILSAGVFVGKLYYQYTTTNP